MDATEFVAQLVSREHARRNRRGQTKNEYVDHTLDAVPMPPMDTVRGWCERFARAADERDADALDALAQEVSAWRSPAEPWGKRPTWDLSETGLSREIAATLVADIELPRVEHVVDAVLHRPKQLLSSGLTRETVREVRQALERFRAKACGDWKIQELPDPDYTPRQHPAGADQVNLWTRRFGCLARDNSHPKAIARLVQEVVNWTPNTTAWEDRPVWDLSESDGGTLPERTVVALRDGVGCLSVLDVLEFLVRTPESEMEKPTAEAVPAWNHGDIERAITKHHARVQSELAGASELARLSTTAVMSQSRT